MEIRESNKCLLCDTEKEDIKHAFLECSKVEKLWQDIEIWIKDRTQTTVKLSYIDKISGRQNAEEPVDKIIISAKVTIFNNSKNGKKHHIEDVKRLLFRQLKVEEYHASLYQKEIHSQKFGVQYMMNCIINIHSKLLKNNQKSGYKLNEIERTTDCMYYEYLFCPCNTIYVCFVRKYRKLK